MEQHTKWYVGSIISALLAMVTAITIIGGVVFGFMSIGCLIKGYESKHGDRPWWTKSFFELRKERQS